MTLKAVVENLDDVPEALHGEYVERDGKYYLDVDDSIRTHTSVVALQRAHERTKDELKRAKADLTAASARVDGLPEDFDPAKYAEVMAEYERLKSADPAKPDAQLQQLREQYEQRIKNMETKHADAVAKLTRERDERDGEVRSIVAGQGLQAALVEVGVKKELMKGALAMLGPNVKVTVDEESGRREPVVETDLGPVPVKQFVETWARSDEGKHFVVPPTGGGAAGSQRGPAGPNPFSHEGWNVTEQGKLYQADPARAQALARAAGTTVGGARPPARAAA